MVTWHASAGMVAAGRSRLVDVSLEKCVERYVDELAAQNKDEVCIAA